MASLYHVSIIIPFSLYPFPALSLSPAIGKKRSTNTIHRHDTQILINTCVQHNMATREDEASHLFAKESSFRWFSQPQLLMINCTTFFSSHLSLSFLFTFCKQSIRKGGCRHKIHPLPVFQMVILIYSRLRQQLSFPDHSLCCKWR